MKINAHEAHQRLWNWLAENPSKRKFDWPEWEENGGRLSGVFCYCFACEIGGRLNEDDKCRSCPIGSCNPFYTRWVEGFYNGTRARNAKKIASLLWNGPKMIDL